jgi:lipoprotein-anchoring transpeptidase ErfK/SrfK
MIKNYQLGVLILACMFGSPVFALPDICSSPDFVCQELGPNNVVIYPVGQNHQQHSTQYRHQERYTYVNPDHEFTGDIGDGLIEVDLEALTWTAYSDSGEKVRSGKASGGKAFCKDIGRECRTVTGTYTIYNKEGEECKSTRFPVGKGGAPMPYCMFFHGGYALHGSNSVPDYNASHGCVRMAPDDAQWLNENFVQVGKTRVSVHY